MGSRQSRNSLSLVVLRGRWPTPGHWEVNGIVLVITGPTHSGQCVWTHCTRPSLPRGSCGGGGPDLKERGWPPCTPPAPWGDTRSFRKRLCTYTGWLQGELGREAGTQGSDLLEVTQTLTSSAREDTPPCPPQVPEPGLATPWGRPPPNTEV